MIGTRNTGLNKEHLKFVPVGRFKRNFTGNSYGRLFVLGHLGRDFYAVECSCGNVGTYHIDIARNSRSCGTCEVK